jgi:DNA-binding XRE family transcriptional regulator
VKLDAERVVEGRERLGLTQVDAAEQAEIAPGSWFRAEHGLDIRPITARRIARSLDLEVSDLYPKALAPQESGEPRESHSYQMLNQVDWQEFAQTLENATTPEEWHRLKQQVRELKVREM